MHPIDIWKECWMYCYLLITWHCNENHLLNFVKKIIHKRITFVQRITSHIYIYLFLGCVQLTCLVATEVSCWWAVAAWGWLRCELLRILPNAPQPPPYSSQIWIIQSNNTDKNGLKRYLAFWQPASKQQCSISAKTVRRVRS